MLFQCLRVVYVAKLFRFSVTFLTVLLLVITIFYPLTYANIFFENVKKYTVSNFLKQTKTGFARNLSSANDHKEKRSSHLLTENSNESSLWSNAFNFKKTINTQTDPRTGMLSAHIKIGSLISNEGHGPDIDLQANYNSGTTANPDGLGYGWSWNLTHFNPLTNQLTTSTGQNFYLKKNQSQWFPLYHKFQDIRIDSDKKSAFVITYANGLRETLNHDGYEAKLQQQNGWSVHFSYVPGTHLLQSIIDDEGHCIALHYTNDNIYVINKDALGKPVALIIDKSKNEMRNISFQSPQHYIISGLHIRYMKHLITQLDYPTGLAKKFYYDCKSAMKIPVSDNSPAHALCVITKASIDPGANQPIMIMHYYYSEANRSEHNYLGFNSGLSVFNSSFKDILFEAPVNYTYQTITDNGLIKEVRTYNKYHLLIDDKKISVHTGKKLSEVQTFFCHINNPNGCAHSSFANLPIYYSLPLKIVTKLWSDGADYPAISTEKISYDEYGRANHHKDAYGRLTVTKYCPQQGDTACPPVPYGWLAGALIESVIQYPAPIKTATVASPPVKMYNHYRKIPAHTGSGYTMVLDHQIIRAEQQYTATKYRYYQDTDNPFLYGLLKQTIFTGSADKASSVTSLSKHYYYSKSVNNKTKTTYTAVDLKSGKQRLSSTITTSLFTNQTLKATDATGSDITCYHYDFMGRLIQTDYAVGTPFAVSRYYSYTVSNLLNQILITSPNNLQQKTIFDGAGRILIHFNQAIAATGKPISGRWFPVRRISYDHYGRIWAKHTYTIQTPDITNEFTTTQNYDDSGRIIRTHLPDNREMITAYDDADRCVVHYEKSSSGEYSAISVVHANILYQPVMKLLFPAPDKSPSSAYRLCHLSADVIKNQKIKVSATTYDAFGRAVMNIDPLGHVVKIIYNSLGATTDIIDPKGNKIHSIYDLSGHLIQSWAYPVSGGSYLLSSAKYNNAGELLWSAGEDGCRSTFTYNKNGRLLSVMTPSGHIISLQYNVLELPVTQSLDGKLQRQLQYDLVTRLVTEKKDITGKTTFIYDADGLIRQLIHAGANGYSDYKLKWEYDINRRIIASVDIAGNQIKKIYDIQGRVKKIIYHPLTNKAETVSSLVYDNFSRIKTLHYGSRMDRHLFYDTFGHLMEMTDSIGKCRLYGESFHYDANDNITILIQKFDQFKYARLNYHYDALNNLMSMTCKGSDDLYLCPRDTNFSNSGLIQAPVITRQDYNFTPLNRLSSVREILQDLSTRKTVDKVMNYHYSDRRAPLRLQLTDTTWNHQKAVPHHFYYDLMGNITTDEEGNHLLYNAFNQIVQVTKTDGQRSYYSYDSGGKTVKTVSAEGTRYLFYQGSQLINEKIKSPKQMTHLVGYLGAVKTIDGIIKQYNETSYKGDVVGILKKINNTSHQYQLDQRNIYSPYGMVFRYKKSFSHLPLYQKTLYGFDGELTDPTTGWQFLGNGHRTYNPVMRYFVSEDPAGSGYGFGSNNPIMNSDPSGNTPRWMGSMFKWFGNITSFGLNALHAKWANIASTVIMTGLAVVTLGASAATYGGSAFGAAVAGCAAISGSIPVIAASIPSNKGLNMAASVIGLTEMAATFATVAADIGFFLSGSLSLAAGYTVDFEMANPQMLKMPPGNPGELITLRMDIKATIQLLKENSRSYIILEPAGEEHLIFNSFEDVVDAWKLLKSKPNDLIVCDTAVLLVAAQKNEKLLYLSDLTKLLEKKKSLMLKAFTGAHSTDPPGSLIIYFINLLNKLSHNEKFVMSQPPFIKSIKDILTKPGEVAVLFHHEHTGVVAREYEGIWSICDFYHDGTVEVVTGSYEKIEKSFFSNFPEESIYNNTIYGYLKLQYFTVMD